MKTTPFWTEECPRPADLPVSDLPPRVDVAVIGSGYTGLNAAIALCRAGASVAVLEQQTIGWGASSRNGGMATTGLKEEMPNVFKRYGAEMGRAFWQWALDSIDHVEQTVEEEEIACDFARPGHVTLAFKPSHYEHFAGEAKWFHDNLAYEDLWVVDKEQVRAEIGSTAYFGGIVDRNSAALHPARYVFGLAQAAARRGAHLVEHAELSGLARAATGFHVITSKGEMQAGDVLMATNGYTGNVVPGLRRGIFPVGSYIITTEPLSLELRQELSPRGRMFFDSRHFLNYFRITPDGRMLFGGRHNLSPDLDLLASAHMMRRRMVTVFPQLRDVPLTHTWTGKLGLTFDLMPHVGRVDGVAYACGYAGHGVSVASYLGKEAGEMLAGKRATSLFAQIKHARYPFTPYDKLYLPIVSQWFRFLDRVS